MKEVGRRRKMKGRKEYAGRKEGDEGRKEGRAMADGRKEGWKMKE